jgi:3-deoxy-D-manno-octulosonic-acid transferase
MSTGPWPAPILKDPNRGLLRRALHGFYDLVWWLAILLASPWWVWRSLRSPAFGRMVRERLGFGLPSPPAAGERQRILIHGVSVGEVKAASSLVALLAVEHPELEVVISTTTDTGVEIAEQLFPGLRVVRFPIDPSLLVTRFLRRVAPVCVVLIELEIWPNFLRAANRLGVPIAVVNGRITDESYRSYRSFRHLLPQFNRISLFCVQSEEYAERFAGLGQGSARILVTGNVKADSLGDRQVEPGEELLRLLGPAEGQLLLCCGSTHDPEELWLTEAWRAACPEVRLVLVPRHPRRAAEVVAALAQAGQPCQTLSALRAGEIPDPSLPAVVDTIGELERIYSLADLVFVGGSLVPHGGQNMLEPAAQGCAVVYGPHVDNFLFEAGLLESMGAGVRLADRERLGQVLAELLLDSPARRAMGAAGLAAVEAQKGATRRTLEALEERCLPSQAPAV